MAEAEDLDVERFISEVRSRPVLWNAAHDDYFNKRTKRSAWMSICRVFCEGFDRKSESRKNEICNKLMNKWRNLKDNFIKQRKKVSLSSHASKPARKYNYTHFKKLQFLTSSDAATDPESSLTLKNEPDDSESNSTPTEVPRNLRQSHETVKRKRDQDSPPAVDSAAKTQHSTSTADPNPDRLFFESILPYMAGFSEDQRLEFRCEVLNTIKQIRTPVQNDSTRRNYGYPADSNAQHLSSLYTSYDLPQVSNH